MALKAKKPEAVQNRLKMFLYGEPGAGKTWAAIAFPTPYIIDAERGTSNYKDRIDKSGGAVLQTSDIDEVIEEVRLLTIEKHNYKTLLIDPITMVEADLMEKALAGLKDKDGNPAEPGDMRVWNIRDKKLKRLVNLLYKLDMNVIVTAHGKIEYAPGGQMKAVGTTHDAWKRWPFVFDLSLELARQAGKRIAFVKKTRIAAFPDGERFEFSYEEIAKRFDPSIMERTSNAVVLASPEQVAQLKHLLTVVSVPEETVGKWFAKAGVDCFEDMSGDAVAACIKSLKEKVEAVA